MEIREIGKLLKASVVQKNSSTSTTTMPLSDSITLSAEALEAKKKIDFVSMLKAMPERDPAIRVVAEKIYQELKS